MQTTTHAVHLAFTITFAVAITAALLQRPVPQAYMYSALTSLSSWFWFGKPASTPQPVSNTSNSMAAKTVELDKNTPDAVWKQVLDPEQYRILREKGTERAGTGEYNKVYDDGIYKCAGCGAPLYKAEAKFNSGCGWPAFYEEIPGSLERITDVSHGMKRVEIVCAKCGGHMGHVFEGEGFPTPTNARHCVNSKSIKFVPKQEL